MDEHEESLLKERLRLKWLPVAEGFDPARADDYDRFLALSVDEQTDLVRKMNEDDAELYITLSTARVLYRDPVDRETGVTDAKVARYPERYRWDPKDSP